MAKAKSPVKPAAVKTEKVVKANAAPERTKGHKARFICALFDAQAKAKLSDIELAKKLKAEYPDSERPWERVMPSVRRHYNAGKFVCQTSAPKIPLVAYNDKGEAVTRNKPGPKAPLEPVNVPTKRIVLKPSKKV
jgi:hypothetical protein